MSRSNYLDIMNVCDIFGGNPIFLFVIVMKIEVYIFSGF